MISLGRIFGRSAIVFVWLCMIVGFLYVPRLLDKVSGTRSISVLAWPNILDAQYVKDFEKETGIKVYMSYFENYEELFVKLNSSGGAGYDLVMPSDFITQLLIKHELLKPIDKKQLNFYKKMHPFILNHSYDPGNKFTIPIGWSVYGLGIDTDYFGGIIPERSWSLLFNPSHGNYKVGMPDDAREVLSLISYYLFGYVDHMDKQMIEQAKQLLIKQRDWVAMYSDMRTDYLLITKAAPVVAGMHPDLSRAVKNYENLEFIIPDEGSFVVIDSLAIPAGSQRDNLVYAFINYLYRPEVLQKYVDRYGFFSPIKGVRAEQAHLEIDDSNNIINKLHFINNIIDDQTLAQLWIEGKS